MTRDHEKTIAVDMCEMIKAFIQVYIETGIVKLKIVDKSLQRTYLGLGVLVARYLSLTKSFLKAQRCSQMIVSLNKCQGHIFECHHASLQLTFKDNINGRL